MQEKKTAEDGKKARPGPAGCGSEEDVAFLAVGGRAQQRYESLRAYMLLPRERRSRTSAARFDLGRFERFGLLGLLERDPIGEAWRSDRVGTFHVEVIPVGTADAAPRRARLYPFLYQLASGPEGGLDASRGSLRSRIDRDAGEGANDGEPARRSYALR